MSGRQGVARRHLVGMLALFAVALVVASCGPFGAQAIQTPTATILAATRTPTATRVPVFPYFSAVPGPGCDPRGHWTAKFPQGVTCFADRLRLSGVEESGCPDNSVTFGSLDVDSIELQLPMHFTASVRTSTITTGATIFLSAGSQDGQYFLFVAEVGLQPNQWQLVRVTGAGDQTIVLHGSYAIAGAYTLAMALNGSTITFSINGVQVSYADANPFPPADHVAMGIVGPCGATPDQADFQDFRIDPLP